MALGSAYPLKEEKTADVRGRNLITGLPESIEISSIEIREALAPSVQVIIDTVKDALDESPPEILSDLMDSGICLSGGSSQLQDLAERLANEIRMRVRVAEAQPSQPRAGFLKDMLLFEISLPPHAIWQLCVPKIKPWNRKLRNFKLKSSLYKRT